MRKLCLLLLLCGACPGEPPMTGAADLATEDALPPGACAAEQPCRMGLCAGPGDFVGCGACRPTNPMERCDRDADCQGAGLICEADPRDCLCQPAPRCRPGCTKDACGEGEACGVDRRCAGKPCTTDTECPSQFSCGRSGRCERQACRTSAGCEAGYCVGGLCRTAPGRCELPPP